MQNPPINIQPLLREAVEHHRAGRRDQAEQIYRKILSIDPQHRDAMQLLGVIAHETGRHDQAIQLISAAIKLAPKIAGWHSNLGSALRAANRVDEAIAAFRRSIELDPNSAAVHFNLANALTQNKQLDQAIVEYRRAAELAPRDPTAQRTLAEALYEQGETRAAIEAGERAIQLLPRGDDAIRARLFDATMMPMIYDSIDEIHQYRRRAVEKIRALHEEGVQYPLARPPQTLFRLAYQGLPNVDVLRDYAALMAPPALPAPDPARGNRIRIGFISAYLRNHTVGRLSISLFEKLSRERFEVIVFSLGAHSGAIADRFRAAADQYVVLPNDLAAARKIVLENQLDVLFYTDIGMDRFTYALAFSRLAPVQCVTWGHSVTSGVPAIDYYISSEEFEAESAQEHYSERLIRLPASAIAYERPVLERPKRRADFNLPDDAHFYGGLQMLFKFHPDFDELIAGVLRRDPQGVLLLVEGTAARWRELLMSRFARTMSDVIGRIRWLPRMDGGDFFAVTALCDVMLDPPHFGGCTTSVEALAFGVPIVTLPAPMLHGRFTQGFYRMMEIDDCIVSTPQQYIDLAVDLGTNRDRRQSISQKILSRCDALYDNRVGVRALEELLVSAIQRK